MSLLQLRNGTKVYPEQVIFKNISLQIQKRDRIGLIGANGMGKSTLLEVLAKKEYLDEGEFITSSGLDIGYLEQSFGLDEEAVLYQEMLSVYQEIFKLEERLRNLEAKMGETSGKELDKVMNRYSRLRQEIEDKEGYSYESKIKGVLRGLGFSEEDFNKKLTKFSGGQKTRAALAKLLLQEPNLLLLDEPSNHLDLQAKEWLEEYLQDYPGAVIIVSHDRYLLEKLANRIWELEKGRLEKYKGSYSFYLTEKEKRLLTWQREYEQQQKKIKELKAFIRKYRAGIKSKQARGRKKKLERMDKIPPPPRLKDPEIEFKSETTSGEEVLTVRDLAKSYDEELILEDVNFKLYRGEKAAVVGPNGSGKSTLLKILVKLEKLDEGKVIKGTGVKVGYYDQEHETLNYEYNLVEELRKVKKMREGEARDILAKFLFTGEDVFRPVSTLSGGEKARLALAKLSIQNYNLLLLDEPTNHLDIKSRELLQEALNNFPGTILMISHDRYLLDELADKIFIINGNNLNEYIGNYSDYREEYKSKLFNKQNETEDKQLKNKPVKEERESKKEDLINLEELEEKIISLETELEELEEKISEANLRNEQKKLVKLTEEYQEVKEKLEEYYKLWETAI